MAHGKPAGRSGNAQRQLRVAEVIRHALSQALARGDLHDPDLSHVSVTVSEVRMAPDLKLATAYVLPLGGLNTDVVIAALERNKSELRRIVTAAVKLKFSPDLRFLPDTTFDEMDKTRALLESDAVRRDLDKPDES